MAVKGRTRPSMPIPVLLQYPPHFTVEEMVLVWCRKIARDLVSNLPARVGSFSNLCAPQSLLTERTLKDAVWETHLNPVPGHSKLRNHFE